MALIRAFCFIFAVNLITVRSEVHIPGLRHFRYNNPGDVTIAVFLDLHEHSAHEFCSDRVAVMNIARVEAILYMIDKINHDDKILPNITMGAAVFDSCKKDTTALASAVQLIPASDGSAMVSGAGNVTQETPEGWHVGPAMYDVAGLLGVGFSRQAVMVAGFLSLFHIPVLSQWATSDELSDQARFPYFMRLIPPDMYQTQVMVEVASYFNWTYVSLIYGEGSYGENAGRRIEKLTKARGMCLAVNKRISSNADQKEFESIANLLWANKKARAVLIVLEHFHLKMLLRTMAEMGMNDQFIWIGSEAFTNLNDVNVEPAIKAMVSGSFFMNPPLGVAPNYIDYFGTITPDIHPHHPWLKPFWTAMFNCDWATNSSCREQRLSSMTDKLQVATKTSKDVDGTTVYAHALHGLISRRCPEAFRLGSIPEGCMDGRELLDEMMNTRIPGVSEPILAFDEKGDLLGSYNILQLHHADGNSWSTEVGRYSRLDGQVDIHAEGLAWIGHDDSSESPKSKCSEPCGPRETTIATDVSCCWECRPCKKNEILPPNATICEECPEMTWPDETQDSTCRAIPPTYLCLCNLDWIGVALTGISAFGVVTGLLVTFAFFLYRKHKLIKATGRELSSIVLVGALLAYCDVFLYVIKPAKLVCPLRDGVFHLAITLLYAPLLLKTIRIYRIFISGKKGKSRVKFISSGAQMMFLTLMILIQVVATFASLAVWPSQPLETMPQPGQPYVELYCNQKLPGFILPLTPNLIVVIACAVLGFLSRKLPENFNESWFIFVSVSTTLFMWLVFLPTYFSAFYASHKVALLAFCLILNSVITVCCQFVPKVYAVKFIGVEQMDVKTNNTMVTTVHVAPTSSIA